MFTLLRFISYPMALMGMGVIPLFWNPLRKSALQKLSFLFGILVIFTSLWFDREIILNFFYSIFLQRIARFIGMYFSLWWNHEHFFILTSQLQHLSKRYSHSVTPRKYWPLILSVLILSLSGILFTKNMNKKELFTFIQNNQEGISTSWYIVYKSMSKFIHFIIPALYLIYVSEFTHLFRRASTLWKLELDAILTGALQSNLQPIRIFHSEISSVISSLKNAFGINLLLYFVFAFADILIAFQSFSYNYEEYIDFMFMVISGFTAILLMIKFTQDMTEASEEITSNLKSLELSNISSLDQLQVELLVQKVQCRPVVIDVCGMFTINRQLLAEILMGATTCCNSIVQLRPYIRLRYSENDMNSTNYTG